MLKILVSCRLLVFNDLLFQCLNPFTENICDLSSRKHCLTKAERTEIIKLYLKDNEISVVNNLLEYFTCFLLLCRIGQGKSLNVLVELFSNPVASIKNDVESIIRFKQVYHYCALVFCILFPDGCRKSFLNSRTCSINVQQLVDKIMTQFLIINVESELYENELWDSFKVLDRTYLMAVDADGFKFIHDKSYEVAAVTCANRMPKFFIKHGPSNFLANYIYFECFKIIKKNI